MTTPNLQGTCSSQPCPVTASSTLSYFFFIHFKFPSSTHLSPWPAYHAPALHEAFLTEFLVLIGEIYFQVENRLMVIQSVSCPKSSSGFGLLSLLGRDQVLRPEVLNRTQLRAGLKTRKSLTLPSSLTPESSHLGAALVGRSRGCGSDKV